MRIALPVHDGTGSESGCEKFGFIRAIHIQRWISGISPDWTRTGRGEVGSVARLDLAVFPNTLGFVGLSDSKGRQYAVKTCRAVVDPPAGMEAMKAYLLEGALMAACATSTIVVVWWGIKILIA